MPAVTDLFRGVLPGAAGIGVVLVGVYACQRVNDVHEAMCSEDAVTLCDYIGTEMLILQLIVFTCGFTLAFSLKKAIAWGERERAADRL